TDRPKDSPVSRTLVIRQPTLVRWGILCRPGSRDGNVRQPAGAPAPCAGRGGLATTGRPLPAAHPALAAPRPQPRRGGRGRRPGGHGRPYPRVARLPAAAHRLVPPLAAQHYGAPPGGLLPLPTAPAAGARLPPGGVAVAAARRPR